MISCPTVEKKVIRYHYNLTTFFYWLLWGKHIHHGLWEGNESCAAAQLNLTETLASLAQVTPDCRLLDVGCGMGGSSIHLARKFKADVTGVTISPVQRRWAATSAMMAGVGGRTQFICQDAEQVEFEPDSFDRIWSIECTEHLFDKPAFFKKAVSWLKPGGRVSICAWLAGDHVESAEDIQQVYDVCEGFFCPSLGSSADYVEWLTDAGLEMEHELDWTERVDRTWEICKSRMQKTGMPWLARMIDQDTVMFLDRFETILKAYRTGAMKYGCFVAHKPE
ncbi:MAG: hypothetical protein CMJ46_00360 [Planctomyces sp.]|nr:hypothetical protein [Planctomyces sp.]